jgi:hypothetical protein
MKTRLLVIFSSLFVLLAVCFPVKSLAVCGGTSVSCGRPVDIADSYICVGARWADGDCNSGNVGGQCGIFEGVPLGTCAIGSSHPECQCDSSGEVPCWQVPGSMCNDSGESICLWKNLSCTCGGSCSPLPTDTPMPTNTPTPTPCACSGSGTRKVECRDVGRGDCGQITEQCNGCGWGEINNNCSSRPSWPACGDGTVDWACVTQTGNCGESDPDPTDCTTTPPTYCRPTAPVCTGLTVEGQMANGAGRFLIADACVQER